MIEPWYICLVFILAQISEVTLPSIMITIKSNLQQILKFMYKIHAFMTGAVALVVLPVYFLVLGQQARVSRFRRILILQHLKKLRQKWLILLQYATWKTRPAWWVCSWLRNKFWFKILIHGNFIEDLWKENKVVETSLNETDAIWTLQDVTYYVTTSGYICYLTLVTNLIHAWPGG